MTGFGGRKSNIRLLFSATDRCGFSAVPVYGQRKSTSADTGKSPVLMDSTAVKGPVFADSAAVEGGPQGPECLGPVPLDDHGTGLDDSTLPLGGLQTDTGQFMTSGQFMASGQFMTSGQFMAIGQFMTSGLFQTKDKFICLLLKIYFYELGNYIYSCTFQVIV